MPRPHSAFEYYVLQITSQFGLSWIKGIGKTIQTNSFGTQLVGEFNSLEQKLSGVYGLGARTDLLMTGSIWNEPRDYMMGLVQHDRYLMTKWSPSRESLVTVAVIATAIDNSSGFVAVEYYFENSDAADAVVAAVEDEVL